MPDFPVNKNHAETSKNQGFRMYLEEVYIMTEN